MKCPNCSETDHAPAAVFCHMCGKKILPSVPGKKGNLKKGIIVGAFLILLGIVIGAAVVFLIDNYEPSHYEIPTYEEPTYEEPMYEEPTYEEPQHEVHSYEEDRVISIVREFCKASVSNDYEALSNLYAEYVDRYHNAYNLSKQEVVEKHENYDSKFGVYGKYINVRWNTLRVDRLSDDEISVVYTEDYSIDREDKTKYSKFVLEEHLILNSDYKIISIYEVQLQKER